MAFTGKATYDSQANELGYDVSDVVQKIMGLGETPLLDYLGSAERPIESVIYEWIEDDLPPRTFVMSTAITSNATATAVKIGVNSLITCQLRPGMLIQPQENGEIMEITSVALNTICVDRAQNGTLASSLDAGQTADLIAATVEEGATYIPGVDSYLSIASKRTRISNYSHIITRPIFVSGTEMVQKQLGGVNQFDYETEKQLRGCLVDLEKAVIASTNNSSIGLSGTARTMKGLRQMMTTNIQSVGATFTQSFFENMIKVCWNAGANIDTLLTGDTYKRQVDGFLTSTRRTTEADRKVSELVSVYESNFGVINVKMTRWLKTKEMMFVQKDRVQVPNMTGRSFFVTPKRQLGDVVQSEVVGEYGLKLFNEKLALRTANNIDLTSATNPAVAAA